jgi:hypothetical protein
MIHAGLLLDENNDEVGSSRLEDDGTPTHLLG